MNNAYEKLAHTLRTKPEVILDYTDRLGKITGIAGVPERICAEIETHTLEFSHDKLKQKIITLDEQIATYKDDVLLQKAYQLANPGLGYFVKRERAMELLEKFPPQNLLDHFGYANVRELVDKQDFASVFASLRFAQDDAWMHKFFDQSYSELDANDFEEREVELKILEPEWLEVAEKFMKHKYHNISHLKELGIIFVVPIKLDVAGESLRTFMLLLHYLNEMPFYSKLFRRFSKEPDFIFKFQSLLRGDVPSEKRKAKSEKYEIRIIQRYLAKGDENDFRLLEPHVNPEAEHWHKAEGDLTRLAQMDWRELDYTQFNLIDLIMSLVKEDEIKYLYHQQEALWNKLFIEYLGRDRMNELIEENIVNGFITL